MLPQAYCRSGCDAWLRGRAVWVELLGCQVPRHWRLWFKSYHREIGRIAGEMTNLEQGRNIWELAGVNVKQHITLTYHGQVHFNFWPQPIKANVFVHCCNNHHFPLFQYLQRVCPLTFWWGFFLVLEPFSRLPHCNKSRRLSIVPSLNNGLPFIAFPSLALSLCFPPYLVNLILSMDAILSCRPTWWVEQLGYVVHENSAHVSQQSEEEKKWEANLQICRLTALSSLGFLRF